MFGITQERFTELVQERGYSVKEEQRRIYYRSFGWRDETFLSVMDGETMKSYYNKEVLAHWVPEWLLVEILNEYADKENDMADLGNMTVKVEPTEEFSKMLEKGIADFKRIHTEYTDDLKKLVAEEVERQMNDYHVELGKRMQRGSSEA